MKIHFKGIYKGKEDELDYFDEYCETEHKPNAVKLPELKVSNIKIHIFSIIIAVCFCYIYNLRYNLITSYNDFINFIFVFAFFTILDVFLVPVHEILHTVFNKQDSYIFIQPKQMYAVVINYEEKSKRIRILGLLFPNLILGIIPFVVSLIFPPLKFLGMIAIPNITGGVGDFILILHYLHHVPNGAKIYNHKDDGSFWYISE